MPHQISVSSNSFSSCLIISALAIDQNSGPANKGETSIVGPVFWRTLSSPHRTSMIHPLHIPPTRPTDRRKTLLIPLGVRSTRPGSTLRPDEYPLYPAVSFPDILAPVVLIPQQFLANSLYRALGNVSTKTAAIPRYSQKVCPLVFPGRFSR